jgi:hypothetical protein
MGDPETSWYWCDSQWCLRYRVPTDLLPGEDTVCPVCKIPLQPMPAPPL